MRLFVALPVVLLAASTSVSSSITIPLTKRNRTEGYSRGVADADRTRATHLKSRGASGPTIAPLNNQLLMYTASVGIGNPPTYYSLLIDTGSSNTFCGTGTPYVQTSTSIPTGQAVGVTYVSGNWTGEEYLDQVTLASNLVLKNQSIGDALVSYGFQGLDGILGLGPVGLTNGTLLSDANATIPTVMNNLVSQGLIKDQVLGVYFSPSSNSTDTNGALTYGGIDSSLCEGEVMYVPVTKTYPSSNYWGINVTLSTYGMDVIIPTSTAGIVDVGTTLVIFAEELFTAYMNAIPGATLDSITGLIEIPSSSVSSMQPLKFFIADGVLIMDVAAQLIPTDQNTLWGGVAGKQYGVVNSLGSPAGNGIDFILGMAFVERYYTVLDTDLERVGFAQTNNTFTAYQG